MRSPDSPPKPQPRRDALLRATIEIVAERGVAGVTHRAVTERTGVPLTSAAYYFASIDEMVTEALRLFAAERAELLGDVADTAVDEGVSLERALRSFVERIAAIPELERLAFYELLCTAARNHEDSTFGRTTLDWYAELVNKTFGRLEEPPDVHVLHGLFALEIGRNLLHLIHPEYARASTAFQTMRYLIAGQHLAETDPELVDELMARKVG